MKSNGSFMFEGAKDAAFIIIQAKFCQPVAKQPNAEQNGTEQSSEPGDTV